MDNHMTTLLQSAEGRTTLVRQLQKSTALQLLEAVGALQGVSLGDAYTSGWLRSYLTEWQTCLKRHAHRFSYPEESCTRYIRLVRDGGNHGLCDELETFTLQRESYFFRPDDGTLNIQCAHSGRVDKPCYSVPLSDLVGYLIDSVGDYPVDTTNVRVADDSEEAPLTAEALLFAREHAELLRDAHAQCCLPLMAQSSTVDSHFQVLQFLPDRYSSLMKRVPDVFDARLWRIDLTVQLGSNTREFSFFTLPDDDDVTHALSLDDIGLLHITALNGEGGAFRMDCVKDCVIVDTNTSRIVSKVDLASLVVADAEDQDDEDQGDSDRDEGEAAV